MRVDGFCESVGRLQGNASVERGYGALGSVWLTGVPRISEHAAADLADDGEAVAQLGVNAFVALPLTRDGRLSSVVIWYC